MGDSNVIKELELFALNMRKHALKMSYAAEAHAAHIGGGLSIVDILAVLYGSVMNLQKDNPQWEDRDRFILSKGHGVIGYYAALREYGYLSDADLEKFEQDGSFLMGHPVRTPEHGIEFTNGSLGMGLSLGIGTAIAAKKNNKQYRTFVVMGDGETDEGSVWEAIMSAPQFKLDNICVIIDRNNLQLGGETKDIIDHGDLRQKLELFGWNSYELDGHDISQLLHALSNLKCNEKPTAIIANTVKGKGFSFSENNNAWHHAVLTESQYEKALMELEGK